MGLGRVGTGREAFGPSPVRANTLGWGGLAGPRVQDFTSLHFRRLSGHNATPNSRRKQKKAAAKAALAGAASSADGAGRADADMAEAVIEPT